MWEILLLDFLAPGLMNGQADELGTDYGPTMDRQGTEFGSHLGLAE